MARPSQLSLVEMKVLCAWCCREGQPGDLGEREPLDNPLPTHGICAHHKAQFLESLPSRSFPDAELVIVVRRDSPALYDRLKWSFAGLPRVRVILDRRVSDRRAAPSKGSGERRYMRTRRVREGAPSPLGDFVIVRFTPRVPSTPAPVELEQRTPAGEVFDYASRAVDPEHIALIVQTAVTMKPPLRGGWGLLPPSPRTDTGR